MIDLKSISRELLNHIGYIDFKTRFETKHEIEKYLWFMFDQLSIGQQQVLMLIDIHNKTIKECSEIMKISVTLVKTLHDQAIDMLKHYCQYDISDHRFKVGKNKNKTNIELLRFKERLSIKDALTFDAKQYVNLSHIKKIIDVSSFDLIKELIVSSGVTFYMDGIKFMIHKDNVSKIHIEYYDTKIRKLTNELNNLTMKKMALINNKIIPN